MFMKSCIITIEILPLPLRRLLEIQIPPSEILAKASQNKDVCKLLNPEQKKTVEIAAKKRTYDECDTTLLYILLRYLTSFSPPEAWGKNPTNSQTEVAHDVQRIMNIRNTFAQIADDEMTEEQYKDFLKEVMDILKRMDTDHLPGRIYM